jgi:hypothetical protein
VGKRKKKVRRQEPRPCDVCGEPAKTHRVRLSIDGKLEAAWRCCKSCTASKRNALTGKGPTGLPRVYGPRMELPIPAVPGAEGYDVNGVRVYPGVHGPTTFPPVSRTGRRSAWVIPLMLVAVVAVQIDWTSWAWAR